MNDNGNATPDKKPFEKGVISLNEHRTNRFKSHKARTKQTKPPFLQKRPSTASTSHSLSYRFGTFFQLLAVIFGGYLVLRSCGLAK